MRPRPTSRAAPPCTLVPRLVLPGRLFSVHPPDWVKQSAGPGRLTPEDSMKSGHTSRPREEKKEEREEKKNKKRKEKKRKKKKKKKKKEREKKKTPYPLVRLSASLLALFLLGNPLPCRLAVDPPPLLPPAAQERSCTSSSPTSASMVAPVLGCSKDGGRARRPYALPAAGTTPGEGPPLRRLPSTCW